MQSRMGLRQNFDKMKIRRNSQAQVMPVTWHTVISVQAQMKCFNYREIRIFLHGVSLASWHAFRFQPTYFNGNLICGRKLIGIHYKKKCYTILV